MKKIIKDNYKLYFIVLLIAIIVFIPYIISNNGILIFPGDSFEQNYKFWQGGYELFKSGNFSQFNWSLGFGGSIFAYAINFLFDPIFYISLFFPKEWIPQFILISIVIQISLSFIVAHLWLLEMTNNGKASIVGAFIIAFSGYMFFFIQYSQFIKLLFMYPCVLFFVEKYLKKGSFMILSCLIGLTGIMNYYILYQFIPFLCLYTLFRYLLINQGRANFKKIILDGLKFVLIIVIGILISSVVLIPSAYLVMNIPRFTTNDMQVFDHMTTLQLFDVFGGLFSPATYRYDASYFVHPDYHAFFGWGGGVSIYSLAITPLLLPLIVFLKDKYKRNLLLGFYMLLFLFLYFQQFSYLFQMSLETRWFYMFLFLNAITVSYILSDNSFTKKQITISMIFSIIIAICLYLVSKNFQLNYQENIKVLAYITIFNSILSFLFYIVIVKYYTTRNIIFILAINAIFSGVVFYYCNKPIDYKHFEPQNMTYSIENKINDSSFYRVLYDLQVQEEFLTVFSNEPFAHGFKGASFYSSVYNAEQEQFINRFKSTWNMPQAQGRNGIYNLLSFKYWYTFQHNQEVPDGYEFYDSFEDGLTVYINKNYVELGFANKNTINEEAIMNLDYLMQDRIMQKYLVTENSNNYNYNLVEPLELLAILPGDTTRVYDFENSIDNGHIYIETFGIPNVIVELYNNDKKVQSYDFWQFNYVDFEVTKEIDRIVIIGEDTYGDGTEIKLFYDGNSPQYSVYFQELIKNHLTDIKFSNDYISAEIMVDEGSTIFTSIPFDKGWSVYVDNEKIEFEKVNLGFIGFNVSQGNHNIVFQYTTPYLKLGIIISLSSLIILLVAHLYNSRKKR